VRVLLDTTYALRAPYSGTAIYISAIRDALVRGGLAEVIERSNPRREPPAGGGLGSARNLLVDHWWSMVELPRLARKLGVDVIHHALPALAPAAPAAQAVTVHDLAFERLPDRFDRGFRTYAHLAHRAAARRAGAVICVSHTTSHEVQELWGVEAERIVVAPHGPGQPLAVIPARDPSHFLYVGDDEPRKNVGTLLAAYAGYREGQESPLELVLAGSVSAAGPGISVEHRPTAERLAELYARAAALVHPSLYEGFGLTLLEAIGAGVPVITAQVAGAVEVCGDAASYAKPQDPSSFAEAMAAIASRPRLRGQLAERGRERAKRFSWDASARAHLEAYSLARSSR
jgi:glycosyltransferase involved in cell wall biosynthesis